jgi:hypothetical protein
MAMESPKLSHYDIPTRTEQSEFLFRLYFGSNPDRFGACVARAYLDLRRTLTGFAEFPNAIVLRQNAHEKVRSSLVALQKLHDSLDQDGFDVWHRTTCEELCLVYAEQQFVFSVGQAQKWINMAFKYVFVFGEEYIPGFVALYGFGHVPLDIIMLNKFAAIGAPRLSSAWSRLHNYGEYMEFQRWIRTTFPDSAPLAVEFHLYQAPDS